MSSSKRDSFHKNSSDWTCSDSSCGNLNFARRNECNRCHKPREDPKKKGSVKIGQAAAKNSRGLFSADDWSCTKCGNINWARRNQCNICNAKKFVDEEERTGLGGGFNEREKVEYKQRRSSSDDEYDEFGRKKKYVQRSRKKSETSRKSRRDRSSSSSRSRSRSRSRNRRRSSSSSSTSSSDSSPHRRRRSLSPKRSTRKSKSRSRSRSRDRYHDSRKDNRKNERNEKQDIKHEKSPSRSESESESDDDGGDLSKYNLDFDDIDIEALRKK